jgi:branched-chain amino acid transport system permease protein
MACRCVCDLSDLVGAWVSVIIGGIFVVCVMTFRRGFVGEIQRRFDVAGSLQARR